ncbi:MAG: beta-ketoacyl-[acyl-carrier-protein] synthase II [Deltaproteobacteria bacterium]|nr:MAG: beta-ketoacyl-[acyl-carrier-protein] synthase II [Pseudomonadota bacterium]PIE66326.1 MAG: beta-ketoacyl-[acyl-carrier-protein] synthase II [Deltaproteobacteria bacterium]
MVRRVVITGVGLLTPLGVGKQASWDALCAGTSVARPITRFATTDLSTRFACQLPEGYEPREYLDGRLVRSTDPFVQQALVAAQLALLDAGLEVPNDELEAERWGVYVGSGLGGVEAFETASRALVERGPRRVSPYFVPSTIANLAAGQIAIAHGLLGPSFAHVSACASGAHALGDALHTIRRDEADVMLAGASEAAVTPLSLAGFGAMKALSRRNDAPERASRPFAHDRDGFVLGEGAGVLVLEELERARRRGAQLYAEVLGFGATSDAHHITQPAPEGRGAARCISNALRSARIAAADVDHVNAHGTSTPFGDVAETQAIKTALGPRAAEIPITANKSMLGHLLGAGGAVEAAFTALSLAEQLVPPTINLEERDPACDLDYVPQHGRELPLRMALCNSFGFGGTNACLVLSRLST